ncbi:tRNA (adenosine(37)-N6)-dimethylallyltransferase MiaA [Candidiatus Paracoxiella cheracis]|uniref:tRNA (adenosine(37)-N6)-dimethylallyltransferase MiaA n=1 Tax=Candidiatus Paracoxiella cheracis TaxID=3405120 RepID=UPI003BF5525C
MGPTACGKTKLAIELVQQFPLEIISVDSAMVYRGMDIGTAKPSKEELKKAPHRLIDICDPATPYSAGQFCEDALREIKLIHAQNYTPLLVGGTMLYFYLLQHGVADLPTADQNTRDKITQNANEKGWPAMHAQLQEIDPKAAATIHANDSQRIQRALEVYYMTGQTISEIQDAESLKSLPFDVINLIVAYENRVELHQKIAKRFDQMLKNGFIDEVKQLYERGDLNPDLPSMRTVGYRQAWSYLSGDCDYDTLRERAIVATRQLAKRQYTWLRRWKNATWFASEDPTLLEHVANSLSSQLLK